jgi:hypothetical protein
MPVYESYARRKRMAEGSGPDVYQCDKVPESLRTQVQYILLCAAKILFLFLFRASESTEQ